MIEVWFWRLAGACLILWDGVRLLAAKIHL
jgi:hypothetical protein